MRSNAVRYSDDHPQQKHWRQPSEVLVHNHYNHTHKQTEMESSNADVEVFESGANNQILVFHKNHRVQERLHEK